MPVVASRGRGRRGEGCGARPRRSPEEQALTQRLEDLYRGGLSPAMLAIERAVCGCDYGGTSWTSRAQADELGEILGLQPGLCLLEVGAGSGWPGLYLAATTGCDAALVDLPPAGLRLAAERIAREPPPGACWPAVADAAALPFRAGAFDAVIHSDVLCCLRAKHAVLAACRRVIREAGRMAFTVLTVAPDLADIDHRRAVENGPEFIESEADYPTLLEATGWRIVERRDVTADYAAACRRQIAADDEHRAALEARLGAAAYAERQSDWRAKLAAAEDGLLRRELYVAAAGSQPARKPSSQAPTAAS